MINVLALNVADFIVVGIVGISVVVSLLRGFVREALSLVTWIIAVYVAYEFSSTIGGQLAGFIKSGSTRTVVAFIGIFLVIMIAGAILNFFIGRLISVSGLGIVDRLLGVLFGVARGILMVALVVLMIQASPLAERHWWRESQLIPQVLPITKTMQNLFPKDKPPEKSIEEINQGLVPIEESTKK